MGRAAVLRSTQAAALEVNSGSQVRSLFFRVQSASPLAFCCGTGFSAQGAGVGGVPGAVCSGTRTWVSNSSA